ncbi:hypothetical protein BDL97_01G205800 [Sphagnum fallax]|nr:hypothetical protein BDL97_01G205800 [Sphagnum fallax]
MASLRHLYKKCQDVARTISLHCAKVKFNKSLCRLLTNKYAASLEYLDRNIFWEGDSIDLPCKTALMELRRIMLCGQLLVTQWTKKDWWMSVITSSDSASVQKKVVLNLREFFVCVNVLVQMKTNMIYGPALDSLDSTVQQAAGRDIDSLLLSMKEYRRGIFFSKKFVKLAKHLLEKLEAEISNHGHPYIIDIPLDVEIFYKHPLGVGSVGTVFKCKFLGVMAAAKVFQTNGINKEAAEKEASLFSKLRHPNVVQFIGYGVKESQPVIVSELMSQDLRSYLDEKKKNVGQEPPLPLLVAMDIMIQVAQAMSYLHENGVMHRDLKANNVLINVVEDQDGHLSSSSLQVKLTDFGLSKLKLHDSQYTTPMVGTTRWRAPEAFEDKENREKYTKSADVYSFSMLCFEVLTGDVPFKDKPLVTLLESIRDGVRPQLPDVDYCPDYLSALIKKCWATDGTERPQFPMICQLLVDYKAMLLKHPFGQEDVPTDYSQNSQPVDAADTANTTYFIEDDNKYIARLLQQVQSLSVDRPYFKFSLKELSTATDNFSPRNWVRRVDWGELYRGELQDGRPVAIKCLNQEEPGKEKFFKTEIEINTCLSHANIVSLIGYCVGKAHLILVYDFLPQGTLEDHLHGEEVLEWEERYRIAVGICKALEYIHDGSPQPVIHMNVKPSNILLSHDLRPQLSDFGLGKWAPKRPMYICCNDVVGTPGYIDPEYLLYQRVNDKTDVYSFGVVLLELITGCRPSEPERCKGEEELVGWARPLLDERNLDKLVDPQLGHTYNVCQMQAMISAAALCVQQSSQHRPQISQVLKMLDKDSSGEEGLSTGGKSLPLDAADTADTSYVINNDNNHHARNSSTSLLQQVQSLSIYRPYSRFSFKELGAATASFSPANLVGGGAIHEVYRGELQDGRLVAIRCQTQRGEQAEEELLTQIEINSYLSHANIVSIIGYCVEKTELILVYDFLPQGTLEDHLHGQEVLGWELRYKIAVGICKALEYLHDGSPRSVIHRDVKPSNILLSHDFRPQVYRSRVLPVSESE